METKKADENNNRSTKATGKNYEKYSLRPRSIQNRIETETRKKKVPKPKERPPPLSKYRRKTANARERGRMQEINYAFECLQNVVPQYALLQATSLGKPCEKLTKITTLRLAMSYIEALKDMLAGNCPTPDSFNGEIHRTSFDSSQEFSDGSSNDSFLSAAANLVPLFTNSSGGNNTNVKSGNSKLVQSTSPNFSLGSSCEKTVQRSSQSNSYSLSQPTQLSCQTNNGGAKSSSQVATANYSIGSPIDISLQPVHTSSYTVSVSSPGPDCIQTVMRGIVSPSNAVAAPTTIQMQHFPPMSVPSPSASSTSSGSSGSSGGIQGVKLPSISSTFLKKSMSSFIQDCTKLTSGRTGSLSSLNESDFSEYASDFLSDEGSTCLELDDPLFQDIMRPSELDLFMESDPDSLPVPSDFSDS